MDIVCASLAFIDGLGTPEMLLIFVIVLVLFGGQKLPEFARGLGKTMREFKKAAAGVEEEFKRALDEDERKQIAAAASITTPQILPASETPVHDEHGYGAEPGPAATADAGTAATSSTTSEPAAGVPSAETAAGSAASDTGNVPTTAADIAPATPPLPGTPDPSTPPPASNTPPPPAPKRAHPNPAQLPDYL